jgi:hypothetical protein
MSQDRGGPRPTSVVKIVVKRQDGREDRREAICLVGTLGRLHDDLHDRLSPDARHAGSERGPRTKATTFGQVGEAAEENVYM